MQTPVYYSCCIPCLCLKNTINELLWWCGFGCPVLISFYRPLQFQIWNFKGILAYDSRQHRSQIRWVYLPNPVPKNVHLTDINLTDNDFVVQTKMTNCRHRLSDAFIIFAPNFCTLLTWVVWRTRLESRAWSFTETSSTASSLVCYTFIHIYRTIRSRMELHHNLSQK